MSDYETKRGERIERLKERAARLHHEADAARARAEEIGSRIPMGQPVLSGHHSQRRHERDLERIRRGHERSMTLRTEAMGLERRAKAAESNRSISSDDPEAVDKLRAKLADLDRDRARMVAANKAVRSKDPRGALASLGFSADAAARLLTPDFAGRVGFPDYVLKNQASEAARLRKRVAELEAKATAPARDPIDADGVRIEEVGNRVRLVFSYRPVDALRAALKAAGFRWAPTVGAWQRHASEAAWCAARGILSTIERGTA